LKTRKGFVSNSSSVSYVIKLNINDNDLRSCLMDAIPYYRVCDYIEDEKDRLIKRRVEIDGIEKRIKPSIKDSFYCHDTDCNQRNIVRWALIDDCKDEYDKLLMVLEDNYISIEHDDMIAIITAETNMHNDYQDMPKLMKAIALYLQFENKYVMRSEIIHH